MITFSEWLNLHEMPMKINLVGDNWNKPHMFDDRSTKMLNSEKAKAKIIKRMQNVPYDFNVYFIQMKDKKLPTTKISKKMMPYYYEDMGIKPEQAPIIDGKINMFVGSWEFDPPTAWMIIHRFAHSDGGLSSSVYKLLINAGKQLSRPQNDHGIVSSFGTMKSALGNNLGGADEPSHEIITQFIMSKKITFNTSRKIWATKNDDNILKQLATELEQTIQMHLKDPDVTEWVYFLF